MFFDFHCFMIDGQKRPILTNKRGEGLEEQVLLAQSDPKRLEELVASHQAFILKTASDFAKRHLTTSDEEWSTALAAFIEAINGYRSDKGRFYGFAKLVIRRRLLDAYRKTSRYAVELSVDPILFDQPYAEEEDKQSPIIRVDFRTDQERLRLEIEAANQAFQKYHFSFYDLIKASPKAEKTKQACHKAVVAFFKNSSLVQELQSKAVFPMKKIEEISKVPRKILERHRIYIIAAVEILSEEYPCLADYLQTIQKELDR